MKRSVNIIMILSCLMMFISGCSSNEKAATQDRVNYIGNDTNNIANRGYVAKQGDLIIYYDNGAAFSIGEGLYKVKADGSNKKRIVPGTISDINVVGEWVFYVQETKKSITSSVRLFQLFKVKLDGSEKEKVLDDCFDVNVIGNRIFYRVYVDEMKYLKNGISDYPLKEQVGNIYCLKIDTGEKVKVIGKKTNGYLISGESIIYYDDMGIYKVDVDGNKEDILLSNKSNEIAIDNNLLYYVSFDYAKQESIITILDINSRISKELRIPGLQIIDLCISDKTLKVISSNFKLYEMNKDGTGLHEVYNGIQKIYSHDDTSFGWDGKLLMNIQHKY